MLKELAIENGYTDPKLLEVLAVISDDLTESLVADVLMDGHLCEATATNRVKSMSPVALFKDGLYHSRSAFPMIDYMEDIGINPENAMSMVLNAYSNARKSLETMGIIAPSLPSNTNKWDCYHAIATAFSDNWLTVQGDIYKASILAYEALSKAE